VIGSGGVADTGGVHEPFWQVHAALGWNPAHAVAPGAIVFLGSGLAVAFDAGATLLGATVGLGAAAGLATGDGSLATVGATAAVCSP